MSPHPAVSSQTYKKLLMLDLRNISTYQYITTLTVTNDINTFYYSINISKNHDIMLTFFEGINVKAYSYISEKHHLLFAISKNVQFYDSYDLFHTFLTLCDLPFSLLLCCIAICQYIAIHWVQYIDMENYNIVAVLQDSCHW